MFSGDRLHQSPSMCHGFCSQAVVQKTKSANNVEKVGGDCENTWGDPCIGCDGHSQLGQTCALVKVNQQFALGRNVELSIQ